MKQKQSSGLWLLTIRWGRMSLSKSLGAIPTVGKAITQGISFIASGRRHETGNYLFLNQREAGSFKVRIEKKWAAAGVCALAVAAYKRTKIVKFALSLFEMISAQNFPAASTLALLLEVLE